MKAQALQIARDLKAWAIAHPMAVCMIAALVVVFAMGWAAGR